MSIKVRRVDGEDGCSGFLLIHHLSAKTIYLKEAGAKVLHDDLAEALGIFVHEPDGCRGDCPCKKESQG